MTISVCNVRVIGHGILVFDEACHVLGLTSGRGHIVLPQQALT